jgi:hypothetical protein
MVIRRNTLQYHFIIIDVGIPYAYFDGYFRLGGVSN